MPFATNSARFGACAVCLAMAMRSGVNWVSDLRWSERRDLLLCRLAIDIATLFLQLLAFYVPVLCTGGQRELRSETAR